MKKGSENDTEDLVDYGKRQRISALEAQRDAALFTDFPKDEQRAKQSA
jgi:hypothetical protein